MCSAPSARGNVFTMNQTLLKAAAILLVGDGLQTALRPRDKTLLWKKGPGAYRDAMQSFSERTTAARVFGLFVLGLGLWLVTKQWREQEIRRKQESLGSTPLHTN